MLVGLQRVSKILGVSEATIRRWEKEEKIPPSVRTEGGHRRWHADDIMEVWTSAEKLWSVQLVNGRQKDQFESRPWLAQCDRPGCGHTATNATLYVSGGGMGDQVMFWCEQHLSGQENGKSISGADDGKTVMVRTMRGALQVCVNQTQHERLAKKVIRQLLDAKGVK
jgi:predicted DNA-binding transcriptional regulator AlpA